MKFDPVEQVYLTPDSALERARTIEIIDVAKGARVVDIGCGFGFLARDLALTVGSEGSVVGIDRSESRLSETAERCRGLPQVELLRGDATSLPLEDACCDAAVTTQVYEYVADVAAALQEANRVLEPGGKLLIVDTAWDTAVLGVDDRELNRKVFAAFEDHVAHPNLPTSLRRFLSSNGFRVAYSEVMPTYSSTHFDNRSAGGTLAGMASFVVGRNGLTEDDVARWQRDWMQRADRNEFFFSINKYLFLAVKS